MNSSGVVTRFAPSPTGALHIGGARTALFNWLFARARGGKFLLRIEDTDRVRSTPEATEAIVSGLRWLGIGWDGGMVSQHSRLGRHRSAADELLRSGAAYKCFSPPEEVAAFRDRAKAESRSPQFLSPWRGAPESSHPARPHCLRLKAPRDGRVAVDDAVHGRIQWENRLLDDMIILRTDGSPTYNFAVVVDDHDMAVTHVIRGDDHLSNTARQVHVYSAFGWAPPAFAHVPLILDENGKKLSKRTSAVGLEPYMDSGILPAAMRNYLARLGWSHGDDEFFTTEQAVSWFDLGGLRKSAARLDAKKLANLSGRHMAAAEDSSLLDDLERFRLRHGTPGLKQAVRNKALAAMPILKPRAKSLADLNSELAFIETARPVSVDAKAGKSLDDSGRSLLARLIPRLDSGAWTRESLDGAIRAASSDESVGFGRIAQPLRAALTGRSQSPSVIDVMLVLGRDESLARIQDAADLSAVTSPK